MHVCMCAHALCMHVCACMYVCACVCVFVSVWQGGGSAENQPKASCMLDKYSTTEVYP